MNTMRRNTPATIENQLVLEGFLLPTAFNHLTTQILPLTQQNEFQVSSLSVALTLKFHPESPRDHVELNNVIYRSGLFKWQH
jgi:hypothetical protein